MNWTFVGGNHRSLIPYETGLITCEVWSVVIDAEEGYGVEVMRIDSLDGTRALARLPFVKTLKMATLWAEATALFEVVPWWRTSFMKSPQMIRLWSRLHSTEKLTELSGS